MLQVLKFLFASVLMVLVCVASAEGQEGNAPESGTTENASSAKPERDVSLGVGPGGMQRHVPGRWAMLGLGGINPTDQDVEETMAVIVGGKTNLQYARRLWLPAGSLRQAAMPIRIPANIGYDQHQIDLTSIRIRNSSSETEQFLTDFIGMPSTSRSLLLSEEESRAAMLFDHPDTTDEVANDRIADIATTVNVGRDAAIESARDLGPIYINDHFLPSSPVGLDSLDQLIIASDRVLNDTLSISRLQSWLQSGGQIWIMADRVSPETARALLGDVMCYSVVDRVELNQLSMDSSVGRDGALSRRTENWSSERPVDFLRVLVETDDIACTIDGWPAAFRKRVGSGEILFTTLGARAWVNDGKPLLTYEGIARRSFGRRPIESTPVAELQSFVDGEIGYSIPGRTLIATILGLHLLIVVAAGIWLARRKSLQYLAMVVPVASLLAAAIFVTIGKKQTDAVPSTIALSQVIRNLPDNSEASISSVAAIYSQNARPLEIVSSPDSTSVLTDGLEDGEVKRLQWDDSGRSQWMYVNQPPGVVRHVETKSTVEFTPAWVVRGSFSKQGFNGRVLGLAANRCEDAVVVASPSPSLAVDLTPGSGKSFTSDRNDVLAADQYINSAIVSDVQRDRQQLIRQMLASEPRPFGREPILLLWTDPINSDVRFADGFNRRGSALASLPIQLEPPAAGSEFQIPATFVRIEPHVGTRGTTAIFNARTGQWIEMNKPSEAELQCLVPEVMLPCSLNRADVTIKISAPSRTLDVKCLVDGEFTSVFNKQDPSGVLRFEILDPKALSLSDQGGLVLSLAISQSEDERLKEERDKEDAATSPPGSELPELDEPSRSTWKIDFVHVDFEGTTL